MHYFVEETSILGINLNSDFVWWKTDTDAPLTPKGVAPRHKDLLGAMIIEGQNLWYTSEMYIFVLSYTNFQINRIKSSHTLGVDRLALNAHSVYASGFDKVVSRFEIGSDHSEAAKVTLPNKALSIVADNTFLYVLNHASEIQLLDARDLTTK